VFARLSMCICLRMCVCDMGMRTARMHECVCALLCLCHFVFVWFVLFKCFVFFCLPLFDLCLCFWLCVFAFEGSVFCMCAIVCLVFFTF
jgi:hypothetical protein